MKQPEQILGVLDEQLTPANIPEHGKKQCQVLWNTIPQKYSLNQKKLVIKNNHHKWIQNTIPNQILSQEGSLDSVVKTNIYTHFPTPHQYKNPYFSKSNFKGHNDTLKVINEKFHINKIHEDIIDFPNLATDYIYKYTYVNPHLFITLQHKLQRKINKWDAH